MIIRYLNLWGSRLSEGLLGHCLRAFQVKVEFRVEPRVKIQVVVGGRLLPFLHVFISTRPKA